MVSFLKKLFRCNKFSVYKDDILSKISSQELGRLSQQIFDNVAVTKAFKDLEYDILEAWKVTDPLNVKERESLWSSYRYLIAFKTKLEGYITIAIYEKELKKQNDKII